MSNYFQSSMEHLMAELKRVELKLCLKILNVQRDGSHDMADEFSGLYISNKEIDTIIGAVLEQPVDDLNDACETKFAHIVESLEQLEQEIIEKKRESLRRGITLRLDKAGQMFQLTEFDIGVLLVCLLTEININTQRLYAYLQDDVTKKSPTVNLVLELFGHSYQDKLKARESFFPEAPLMRYQLLHIHADLSSRPAPWLASFLQIDERIVNYLLDIDQVDSRLLPFTNVRHPELKFTDIIVSEETRLLLNTLITRYQQKSLVCHLYGETGAGKKATSEAICSELGIPILNVDCRGILPNGMPVDKTLPLIFREGNLQNAALYFDNYEALLSEEAIGASRDVLAVQLRNYPQWVFIASQNEWRPKGLWQGKPFVTLELPIPSYTMRKQLWERYRDNAAIDADIDFKDLASKFRLTGGQIRNIMVKTMNLAQLREDGQQTITSRDLYFFSRNESKEILNDLARKIKPKYSWPDIILPSDQMEQLREICNYIQYYYKVYGDWGFDNKLSLGKGLNVLFSGQSGTGKTMAAEILAHELQLELYKIDLSTVVSKYIGETEKNLDRIFKEGRTSNAILFFDEADAIFGKRSEVKDAHDRYANIETAYLLLKMDEYKGMVILATNLRKNMDDAFSRRMHFTLEFPIPDETDRSRIWRSMFPKEAPLADDIDFAFLARQFRITGGNIKNVALGAAFLAAQNGNHITMNNIIWATKREYQKIGKLCTEDDFADYYKLVKS